ncbi:hypothetical protein FSP39_021919 [Pinctada imbricata]|uniref:GPCR family 3 nine cysteines domain-containing protein n=1 Tax=Pinctada imbricata TaxID=66713 RepID=A0AA88YPF0_PINIB|nr:hypothetical protein FSP39_021919 [Pinctada imbricata]
MLNFLIDNIYMVFGRKVFQQIVGSPMGTNCVPLRADIFLYLYEAEFVQSLVSEGNRYVASNFNFTYRYIDDVLSINNPKFADYLSRIYPSELEVKETTETNNSASYLDIMLSYDADCHMNFSLYDKRDDFNFNITNFLFLGSNIPSSPAYGVFIPQLIRYARASAKYTDFVLRARRLSDKLLNGYGGMVRFDEKGDALGRYTIMNYQRDPTTGKYEYMVVGNWTTSLVLEVDKIVWADGTKEIPVSRCSQPCEYDEYKYIGPNMDQCCWMCIKCEAWQYLKDEYTCEDCAYAQWPNTDKRGMS